MSAHYPVFDPTAEGVWEEFALNPPILSSHRAGWKGIHFAYYYQSAYEMPSIICPQHVITISTNQHELRLKQGKSCRTEFYTPGYIGILPANHPSPTVQCNGEIESFHLNIDPTVLARVAHESIDDDYVELAPNFKANDPLIYSMGWELKTELELGGVDSYLYAESMATALSVHLLRRYSTKQLRLRDHADGLPKRIFREVIAYINDNLEKELRLADLAAVVNMSPHYFCKQFKQSTGVAPHQYIIERRIERAKLLLAKRNLNIADIVQQVGFKSQSHFTRVFHQKTSVTPKRYRDTL